MKKNIFKKKIIYLLFGVIFLILPTVKVLAYTITPVSFTQPSNGTSINGPFNFSFTFNIARTSSYEPDTIPVQLLFTVTVDGKSVSFSASVNNTLGASSTGAYVFNQTLGSAIQMGKPITISWADMTPKNSGAQNYAWTLKDYAGGTQSGTVYEQQSFTLTSPNTGGYYYITQSTSSDGTFYFYSVQGPFTTQPNCIIAKDDDLIANPTETVYQDCQQYATLPVTPPDKPVNGNAINPVADYYPLAPLPGVGVTCTQDNSVPPKTICVHTAPICDANGKNCTQTSAFGNYLNTMISLTIGICAVLAIIMIIMGGIQYMTSELVSGKEEGRKKVTQAILGLLLALGAYAILNTINPDLVNIGLGNLKSQTITVTYFGLSPHQAGGTQSSVLTAVVCPHSGGSAEIPTIVSSMSGNITYRWGGYGQNPPFPPVNPPSADYNAGNYNSNCPTGTLCLDCAGFVNYVLSCAGITPPSTSADFNSGYGTGGLEQVKSMTLSGNDVIINGVKLNPGDILGWTTTDLPPGATWGHVFIYTGNNPAAESEGTTGWPAGAAMDTFSVTNGKYANDIKAVLRTSS